MDEEMIHKWIDIVLIIWRNAKAPTTIPILNLDAYNVHIMGTIVYCIQSFGIEAIHMLTGCTFLYQPVLLKPTNARKVGCQKNKRIGCWRKRGLSMALQPLQKLVNKWFVDVNTVLRIRRWYVWIKMGCEQF